MFHFTRQDLNKKPCDIFDHDDVADLMGNELLDWAMEAEQVYDELQESFYMDESEEGDGGILAYQIYHVRLIASNREESLKNILITCMTRAAYWHPEVHLPKFPCEGGNLIDYICSFSVNQLIASGKEI